MRKYINDCKALGAHPILMSLTPRDAYDENDKIVRVNKTFGLRAKQVAEQEGVPFVDLNEISAAKLDSYGHWEGEVSLLQGPYPHLPFRSDDECPFGCRGIGRE